MTKKQFLKLFFDLALQVKEAFDNLGKGRQSRLRELRRQASALRRDANNESIHGLVTDKKANINLIYF